MSNLTQVVANGFSPLSLVNEMPPRRIVAKMSTVNSLFALYKMNITKGLACFLLLTIKESCHKYCIAGFSFKLYKTLS